MIIVVLLISCSYIILVTSAARVWHGKISPPPSTASHLPFSIIIIARNEQDSIEACLTSVYHSAKEYNHEIILMDDHSTDHTIQTAQGTGISTLRILRLENYNISSYGTAGKKAGQYFAVLEAKHDCILQTDGDCIVEQGWVTSHLRLLDQYHFVGAPINVMGNKNNLFELWQIIDNIGTMALTYLGYATKKWTNANGGNMSFRRSTFLEYAERHKQPELASGDDLFFAHWCAQQYHVTYTNLPMAMVATGAERTLKSLQSQRLRWATKTTSYKSDGLAILMPILFLFHLSIFIFLFSGMISVTPVYFFLILFASKWLSDTYLVRAIQHSFCFSYALVLSPLMSFLHAVYVVWAGISGLWLKTYNWKGRRVT